MKMKPKTAAKTNKAPVGNQKPVPTGKGAKKMAEKQPPGKRTMMGGTNRNKKSAEDMEV